MKVSIIGAGQVGATAGLLIAQQNIADVQLVDVVEGLAKGKAIDISQAAPLLGFDVKVDGSRDLSDTQGSNIIVMTAGLARKPGMSRLDLLQINAGIVKDVLVKVMDVSPDAVIIMVTNPLDVIVRLALEATGRSRFELFGMGGLLDTSRFRYFIKEATGAEHALIDALVVGEHGDGMLPRYHSATVNGRPLIDVIGEEAATQVADKARHGGAEIVSHLKTGSAFYAPAASVMRMVKAILMDTSETISTCMSLDGELNMTEVALSVPAILGKGGVKGFAPLEPTSAEIAAMQLSKTDQNKMLAELSGK